MTLKKFFFISFVAHLIILVVVYFIPAPQVKKTKEFFTRLVSPEEAKKPEMIPAPRLKPAPIPPETLKKQKPIPAVPRPPRPLQPTVKIPPKTPPTLDKPVVPGEGKEVGKTLPEGITPKSGKGDGKGEEASREDPTKPGFQEGYKPSGKPGLSAREKLFDRGIIGETARKGPGEGAGKKDETITFETKDYRFAGYMRKLREKIESIWEYPAEARQKRLYGDLRRSFTINKDGRLGAIELVRTSGYKSLDDAAIKALRDGEPYWPLPDEWGMDSYTINGHFIYTIYGYGIR